MRGNKRRDTGPERAVRSELHRRGVRFRVDVPLEFDRRRRADLFFSRSRLVVFIDGCFWHGCPDHYVAPLANASYWAAKVAQNRERDRDTDSRLQASGWNIMRFWEHEGTQAIADEIESTVRRKPTNIKR